MDRGKLLAIAVRARPRAPMVELERAEVTTQSGIRGDFRGTQGPRQVTVLSADSWKSACALLGQELPWTMRRANLLVEGLNFADTPKNSLIHIGKVVLRITGETDPCRRMDEQASGLCMALTPEWRGGVCCQVLSGGLIEYGAIVVMETAQSRDAQSTS